VAKAHPDIEIHLGFSEKFRKQLEAHQHETAQLLTDMEQLQSEVRNLLNENEQLSAESEVQKARIAELEAQVAQLESRPYIYTDQFVGVQHVGQQNVHNQLVTGYRRKSGSKNRYIDLSNQLNLWPNTTTSL
jgi:chromosome segregation ATPase